MSNVEKQSGEEGSLIDRANALIDAKEYPEAESLLRPLLDRHPGHPRALIGLGRLAALQGDFAAARAQISQLLQLDPASAVAHHAMGKVMLAQGDRGEAATWFRRALEIDDSHAPSHNSLAHLVLEGGDLESAAHHFGRALEHDPADYDSCFFRGIASIRRNQFDEAMAFFEQARELDPSKAGAWIGIVQVLHEKKRAVATEEACRQGLAATGGNPQLLANYGAILLSQGRVRECEDALRKALESEPLLNSAWHSLLFALNYDPEATQEEIYELARKWEGGCCAGLPQVKHTPRKADAEKVLRIGYVSPDLRLHPVSSHLLPVLRNHDRSRFRIYCYFNSYTGDDVTREIIELSDGWRLIPHLKDEQAQQLIIDDGIDILVDLAGHTADHRLPLFARKPAPVQATWLGYFNTTGLSAIDYLITDDATVLPGEDHLFSEQLLRLPWSRFCFSPFPSLPDVVPPPSVRNGYVTFGSFNNLAKLNSRVISLWSSIMRELPDSRLVLKRGELCDEPMRQRFRDLFAAEGISPERLDLREGSRYQEMLSQYGDIDISLDTFPFSGGMTTLDALVMGVPVVTLSGKLPISRQTRSFLRVLNLLELVATKEERFRSLVVELARDAERLGRLRGELRGRVLGSYLCNGKEFTVNLENAYRTMWRTWCNSAPSARKRKVS